MFIHDMSEAECRQALRIAKAGRIACTHDNQPYVVPIYFAYSENYLYAISTIGQKIDWMRANPLVCVETDNITSHDEWMSIVVFGRYEELPDIPRYSYARKEALALLQRRSPWWWEPACICETDRDMPHSCTPVTYRIHINLISGHQATPDIVKSEELHIDELSSKKGWMAKILGGRRAGRRQERSLQ